MLDEVEDVFDGEVFRGHAAVAEFAGFGDELLDEVAGLSGDVVAHLRHAGGEFDEGAAQASVLDDLGVVLAVGGGGDGADEFVQVLAAAGPHEVAGVGEVFGEGDLVDGQASVVHVQDRSEDELVAGLVEGGDVDGVADFAECGAGEEAGAEGGLLGVEVLGRDALERDVPVVGLEVGGHLEDSPVFGALAGDGPEVADGLGGLAGRAFGHGGDAAPAGEEVAGEPRGAAGSVPGFDCVGDEDVERDALEDRFELKPLVGG